MFYNLPLDLVNAFVMEEMTMRRLIPCVCGLVFLAVGCAGPKAGDALTLRQPCVLFLDEGLYRREAKLWRAGTKSDILRDEPMGAKWGVLNRGSTVRVLDARGEVMKVVVEREPKALFSGVQLESKVGWIRTEDLVAR
jgi:hypothetical protein